MSIAITPVTVVVVTLRVLYKHFFNRQIRLNAEEWTLAAAIVVGISSLALQIFGVNAHGMGTDIWGLDRSTLVAFRRYFYAIQISYVVLMLLLKLTFVFFYLSLFFGKGIRALLWGTIVAHVAMTIASSFVIIFQCLPINYQWDKLNRIHDDALQGRCINMNAGGWVNSAFSVASDIWLLAIPLSQLHTLKLHWKKKLGAALMFTAGTR